MATKITDVSRVPYQSSGVYFREVDLTVVSRATGGFSAALIGLTEKGPAFDITNSATYDDRAFRLGELNPKFVSSYYARQYLEQARNFKEVRILGLEGYSDNAGFAIALDVPGSSPAVPGISALQLGSESLMCVLKKRKTTVTGRADVTSVAIEAVTYTDPVSNVSVTAANDYLFGLRINYADSTNELVIASLRPESNDYILNKFGKDPLDSPLIRSNIASLWIDFIIPSVKWRPTLTSTLGYYLPGSTVSQSTLPLMVGNISFGTNITLQSASITNVTSSLTDVTVELGTDVTAWLANGDYVQIQNVSGTGNITVVNNIWKVDSVTLVAGKTQFKLLDKTTNLPLIIQGPITFSNTNNPTAAEYANPTWEGEVLDFSELAYQTPLTPWIVSDGDVNGDFKRLFRFWSISDGKSANTETKIEIKDIDPSGNNGKGSFSLVVRKWDDRDDTNQVKLETFSNLNLDPKDDNYILRRIGNGEDFALRSKFVLIEMNFDEEIPATSLPWGCFGYPNVTGSKFTDVKWTLDYSKIQPVAKQTLGLANNAINMFRSVSPDQLSFKRSVGTIGKGFHLNPNNNTAFATAQSSLFNFAPPTIYVDVNNKVVLPTEKVRRNKFVVDFYGGFDGWNVYSKRTWGDITSKDYEALTYAVEILRDKESLDTDFTVLVTPDLSFDLHAAACDYVLDMVRDRGDALYIPDQSYDSTADVYTAVDLITNSNMKSNSVATYFPYCQIEDTINKTNVWVPPSIIALGTITYVANNEQVWQPPGGAIRTVTNNLVRTRKRLKLPDRELLKQANINPITQFPGSGYEITEVRTTQEYFSALSFIHNRLLLCYAKKVLNQTLRPLLFQLNSQVSRDAFLMTVRPIFDRIKKLNGVEEYAVDIVDRPELNDRTTLYGRITIVPLYPIERIVIDFVLQDSGVSFNA